MSVPDETKKATGARTVACPGCGGPMRGTSYRCARCRRAGQSRQYEALSARRQAAQDGHHLIGQRCVLCERWVWEMTAGMACPVTQAEQERRERIRQAVGGGLL